MIPLLLSSIDLAPHSPLQIENTPTFKVPGFKFRVKIRQGEDTWQ